MKKVIVYLLLLISLPSRSQSNEPIVLVIKKILNGKVCDSCLVTRSGNSNFSDNTSQVPFLTLNQENQFLYYDSLLTKNFTTVPSSHFFLAVREFSLDFYSLAKQNLRPKNRPAPGLNHLQFKAEVNGTKL